MADKDAEKSPISVRDFLQTVSPGRTMPVRSPVEFPFLRLHCEACTIETLYQTMGIQTWQPGAVQDAFVTYRCRNCGGTYKTYALRVSLDDNGKSGTVYKYGELPEYGPPTPSRLATLVGSERDYFFKGRRSENQGLGIAAFAYYRRVIEHQKNKIFDEVIRVARTVGGSEELIQELESAKKETQFSKGVDALKHALPQALMINGQNPLKLLHGALSNGLHDKSDETCLALARNIRIVLTEFVERVGTILKDNAELNEAVKQLLRDKADTSSAPSDKNKPRQ